MVASWFILRQSRRALEWMLLCAHTSKSSDGLKGAVWGFINRVYESVEGVHGSVDVYVWGSGGNNVIVICEIGGWYRMSSSRMIGVYQELSIMWFHSPSNQPQPHHYYDRRWWKRGRLGCCNPNTTRWHIIDNLNSLPRSSLLLLIVIRESSFSLNQQNSWLS